MTVPSKRSIHVITNCSLRKRGSDLAALLRQVPDGPTSRRVRAWCRVLRDVGTAALPASEVYIGDHAYHARKMARAGVVVWIVSAGYGLIESDALIRPYSATFASGHPDSVADPSAWWSALATASLHGRSPRSLVELFASHREHRFLVALGAAYLGAVKEDLAKGIDSLASHSNLLVVSGGSPDGLGVVSERYVRSKASWRVVVGGALTSLNIRLADWIISHDTGHWCEPSEYTRRLQSIASACEVAPTPRRERLSDDKVATWIRQRLRRYPGTTRSTALMELRAEGKACEQSRFARLFAATNRGW